MKVLLSDASGVTSRQLATILSRKHHAVHVLSPSGLTLTKLTRHVARVHPVPPFGKDPYVWLHAALAVMRREKFDILICSQEQVVVIAAELDQVQKLGVKLAVPEFKSLRRVLDKISASQTLRQVGLPQPESVVISSLGEVEKCQQYLPGFAKLPVATGSMGVRSVATARELREVAREWRAFEQDGKLLVQRGAPGSLLMISGVFSKGRLLAWHSCVRAREGSNGSASKKVSLTLPIIGEHLQILGKSLKWHGALSLDAILVNGKPQYIDINPRIVEPMNGLLSGVDLVEVLLQVSLGTESVPQIPLHGREGFESHQLVLALLRAAEDGRIMMLIELFKAAMNFEHYAGSDEELTPIQGDPWSVLVLFAIIAMLLVGGRWQAKRLSGNAVINYAISPKGWTDILTKQEGKEKAETRQAQ